MVEFKAYKEKPYLNSDKEPFGLTLNVKSKEYIKAHAAFKGMVQKGKKYNVESVSMRILDATLNKAMVNAIVEVTIGGSIKGNVELKVYNPSVVKKKGATIEMRKVTDFGYENVGYLRDMICNVLDGLIAGGDVPGVLKSLSKKVLMKKTVGRVSFNPTLFVCDKCNFQTKFGSALKTHMTRIHKPSTKASPTSKCEVCDLKTSKSDSLTDHRSEHKTTNKRSKATYQCLVSECNSTFDAETKLNEHEKISILNLNK